MVRVRDMVVVGVKLLTTLESELGLVRVKFEYGPSISSALPSLRLCAYYRVRLRNIIIYIININ